MKSTAESVGRPAAVAHAIPAFLAEPRGPGTIGRGMGSAPARGDLTDNEFRPMKEKIGH